MYSKYVLDFELSIDSIDMGIDVLFLLFSCKIDHDRVSHPFIYIYNICICIYIYIYIYI